MLTRVILLAAAFILPACASDQGESGAATASKTDAPAAAGPRRILDSYARAVNEKNTAILAAIVTPDVQWLSVSGGEAKTEVEGRQRLVEWTAAYFENMPTVRSRVEGPIAGAWADLDGKSPGRYIAAREHVAWKGKDGSERRQSALVVFELDKGLIRRVWYFPTEK